MNFGAKIQNCSKSSTVVLYIIIWKIFRKKSLQEKEISKGYKKWKHTPWAKFLTRTSIEIFDQKQDWNLQSIARDNIFNNFLVIIFELNLQSCLISFSNYLNFRAKNRFKIYEFSRQKTLRNLAKVYCPKVMKWFQMFFKSHMNFSANNSFNRFEIFEFYRLF